MPTAKCSRADGSVISAGTCGASAGADHDSRAKTRCVSIIDATDDHPPGSRPSTPRTTLSDFGAAGAGSGAVDFFGFATRRFGADVRGLASTNGCSTGAGCTVGSGGAATT